MVSMCMKSIMRKLGILCVLINVLCRRLYADYDCLCNYRVETPLFREQNENSSPVAYMYEFDCKPSIATGEQDTWFAIMNEHAVAYVPKGSGLQVQVCAGSIPSEDKLLTTTQALVTSTSSSTQKLTSIPTSWKTTAATTTTTKAITTTTIPTTKLATSTVNPTTTTGSTFKLTTSKASTTKPTTTLPTTRSTLYTTFKPTTSPSTPKRFTTTSTTPTTSPYTKSTTEVMTSHSTAGWTRTTDWLIHWNITHDPYTTKYPYTHHHYQTSKKPHYHSTDWLVHWNVTHPPLTTDIYQTSYSHGNLNLCPGLLRRSVDAKWLRQYKDHCYELVHTAKNWHNAEADCWNRIGHGGELLEIYTEDIQNYIMNFLSEVDNHRYLWIGLEDNNREEHFSWDSGAKVTYTNWTPNRKGNHLPHGQENSVMLLSN